MIEATIRVPSGPLGAAAEAFASSLGVWGYAIEDEDTGLLGEVRVRVWLEVPLDPAAVTAALGPEARLDQRPVDPASWSTTPTILLGRGYCVVRPGDVPPDDRRPLYIEVAAAFGDGEHPSTALCVEWLEDQPTLDGPCLDVGTGTGVLLIIAADRGAGPLFATETDGAARAAAVRAFAAHGLVVASSSDLPAVRAGTVLANLPLQALLPLTADLAGCLGEKGRIVVSGFVEGAEARLAREWAAVGLQRIERRTREGWCLWVGSGRDLVPPEAPGAL